jgi:hypothetical protein
MMRTIPIPGLINPGCVVSSVGGRKSLRLMPRVTFAMMWQFYRANEYIRQE